MTISYANRLSLYWGLYCIFFAVSAFSEIRSGTIAQEERWTKEKSPYEIKASLTIPAGVTVTVNPGVDIRLDVGVGITVKGYWNAAGTKEELIRFLPNTKERWGAISFDEQGAGRLAYCTFQHGSAGGGARIGMVNAYQCVGAVTIADSTFTDWPDDFSRKAFYAYEAQHVEIRRCFFGEGTNEGIYTEQTPIVVESNTFAARKGYSDAVDVGYIHRPGPIPLIRKNVFFGSEDDAIDLDHVDAIAEGNWIMNCRGGSHDPIGISGDQADTHPVIVNNVIINCESGIGFKNGADITVINNTIINCDRGIWMHQQPSHATVLNTLIWGRDDQQSIRLEPGSTIDIRYSIIRGAPIYPGEGNQNQSPRFGDPEHFDFHLLPDSPAIDAGLGATDVPMRDFDDFPRVDVSSIVNTGKGNPPYVDIGAFEYQVIPAPIRDWWLNAR